MPIEILMPALSPTMTEGNLTKWLKKEGDKIKPGEVIAEIETDKATMEVEAADSGILGKIIVPAGTQGVKVNELIALILENGEDKALLENYQSKSAPKPTDAAVKEQIEVKAPTQAISTSSNNNTASSRVMASPLAKRIAENEKIDLTKVKGTGPHGRIIRADVEEAKSSKGSFTTHGVVSRNPVEFTRKENTTMRRVIAKRLSESKRDIPHFYLSIECELNNLLASRAAINAESENLRISVNDFMIKAVAMALKAVPEANSSWSEEATIFYNNIDISVAVAIDGGLITPIIKNVDQKTIFQISTEMKDLAKRARENKLQPEEFQGGGFTISNLGMFGIKNFKAIINPPQTCILAIGSSTERPVVKHGRIEIANITDLTLSCDHRVVDGVVGSEFLKALKKYIENPVLMFV